MDGFVAGPNGELDWMVAEQDSKQLRILDDLTNSIDTILLGRKTAEIFSTHWEGVVGNQKNSPEYPYAKIFVDTAKIVFSRTKKTMEGKNITINNSDLKSSVTTLKSQEGKDIVVYGGANFVSELISNQLIDELYLLVNPVSLGKGLSIFNDNFRYTLLNSTVGSNGILLNRYVIRS